MEILKLSAGLGPQGGSGPNPCIVTLGNFDGVHLGHQKLLDLTVSEARRSPSLRSVVVTFDPHPVRFFKPEIFHQIQPLTDRFQHFERFGIDTTILFRFDEALSRLPPSDFIQKEICSRLNLRQMIIGYDTTFGAQRAGTPKLMRHLGEKFGFEVTVVDPVELDDVPISSSVIRTHLLSGRIEEATRFLGHPFRMMGRVVPGQRRGGALLGFPTANLETPETLVPAEGVYAAWAVHDHGRSKAAVSIGRNPTFSNGFQTVEAHLIDFSGDLYDQMLTLDFIRKIRATERFDSIDALKRQIDADVQEARRVLS